MFFKGLELEELKKKITITMYVQSDYRSTEETDRGRCDLIGQ